LSFQALNANIFLPQRPLRTAEGFIFSLRISAPSAVISFSFIYGPLRFKTDNNIKMPCSAKPSGCIFSPQISAVKMFPRKSDESSFRLFSRPMRSGSSCVVCRPGVGLQCQYSW
jgi:hypothetical protein